MRRGAKMHIRCSAEYLTSCCSLPPAQRNENPHVGSGSAFGALNELASEFARVADTNPEDSFGHAELSA